MLAVDALVADPRNLFGQALDQPVIDMRRLDALHARRGSILDPDFAGTVDEDFRHRVAVEPFTERLEIGLGHPRVPKEGTRGRLQA